MSSIPDKLRELIAVRRQKAARQKELDKCKWELCHLKQREKQIQKELNQIAKNQSKNR